ncbi:MAG: hypothetical protein MRZ79_02795 [Bacteroidia bacterium]|nr:hypothetical protein [Bacteroidia bacterium]
MTIRRINFLHEFIQSYRGLNFYEQKQSDFALAYIEFGEKFPTSNIRFPKGFPELYEIRVPADDIDLRIMAFYSEVDLCLYLTHCFRNNKNTNLGFEYLTAEKIRKRFFDLP